MAMNNQRSLFPLASQRIKSISSWLEILTGAWICASRRHRRKQDLSGSHRADETRHRTDCQNLYSWGMKAPTESADERGEEPALGGDAARVAMAQTTGSEAPEQMIPAAIYNSGRGGQGSPRCFGCEKSSSERPRRRVKAPHLFHSGCV